MLRPPTSKKSGFTLLELAIVAVILSVIFGAVGLFERSNRQTLVQSAAIGTAQERAHQALERVLRELDGCSITTCVPDPTGALGTDDLVFQKSNGVTAAGVVNLSTRTRLALALDDGETLNGVDDNGNGLVDERKLNVTYNFGTVNARTFTVAHLLPALFPSEVANGNDDNANGVIDEKGFNIQRVGSLLSVRLAIQARGSGRAWVVWSENSSLRLRN